MYESPRNSNWIEVDVLQGPTAGIKPLREAIANLYNEHHRQGKASKYTWENVVVVPGGRAGLVCANTFASMTFATDYTTDPYCRGARKRVPGFLHTRLHGLQRDVGLVQKCEYGPRLITKR